jgi:hypothetical protein
MRILGPIVLILLLAMLDTWQHFGLRGTVALQFVCDDHTRDIPKPVNSLRKNFIATLLSLEV